MEASLSYFLNFSVAYAGGTNFDPFAAAIDHRPDLLQVDVPAPFGQVVSMTDPVTKLRTAPAHFAHFCHKPLV
jgi:hypothetical protein